ncbi:hypothetical protein MMC21_007223 [Puttea exsequens]|nr:hypothetical protein [Puttea exsequens]
MSSVTTTLFLLLLAISPSKAHFVLNYPPTIGFDDDTEGQAPCGGPAVDFNTNNVTDFHVSGDSIALKSTHPAANWLFRATLDQTATKGDWTNLLPAVSETGLGDYCETNLKVPAEWAGQKGVVSVVQEGDDGVLYQCSAVNFVEGTATVPEMDAQFSSLPATAAATSAPPSAASTAAANGSNAVSPYAGCLLIVKVRVIEVLAANTKEKDVQWLVDAVEV